MVETEITISLAISKETIALVSKIEMASLMWENADIENDRQAAY